MRILYWNIKNIFSSDIFVQILEENNLDIIILSEVNGVIHELEALFSAYRFEMQLSGHLGVVFFSKYDNSLIKHLHEDSHFSAKGINTIIGPIITIIGVHLPSKIYKTDDDQTEISQHYSEIIEEIETREGHCKTLIIGDFNMNPFERGMISHRGFNSTFFKNIAEENVKMLNELSRKYFYNPSLQLYNDNVPYKGTYFKKLGKTVEYYWYMLDQVLIRPDMIQYLNIKNMEVLHKTKTVSLIDENGKPKKIYLIIYQFYVNSIFEGGIYGRRSLG